MYELLFVNRGVDSEEGGKGKKKKKEYFYLFLVDFDFLCWPHCDF